MEYSKEEIGKLKAMMMFLVKKKQQQSAGHCGFHVRELQPILEELEADGQLELRPTINANMYFLKKP